MLISKTALGCSKSETLGFEYGIGYLMIEFHWEKYVTFPSFSLFLSKMGFIMVSIP